MGISTPATAVPRPTKGVNASSHCRLYDCLLEVNAKGHGARSERGHRGRPGSSKAATEQHLHDGIALWPNSTVFEGIVDSDQIASFTGPQKLITCNTMQTQLRAPASDARHLTVCRQGPAAPSQRLTLALPRTAGRHLSSLSRADEHALYAERLPGTTNFAAVSTSRLSVLCGHGLAHPNEVRCNHLRISVLLSLH